MLSMIKCLGVAVDPPLPKFRPMLVRILLLVQGGKACRGNGDCATLTKRSREGRFVFNCSALRIGYAKLENTYSNVTKKKNV